MKSLESTMILDALGRARLVHRTIIYSTWDRRRVSKPNIIAGCGIGGTQGDVVKTGQALWGLGKLQLGYMLPSNMYKGDMNVGWVVWMGY